ncbi:MAG: CmcI family methyltransferase [Nanoarchaeota archaeon]
MPNSGPGPMEAINEFFKKNKDFIVDKTKEKLYMTFNPNGYLKKIK